jgi:hypothetical protein
MDNAHNTDAITIAKAARGFVSAHANSALCVTLGQGTVFINAPRDAGPLTRGSALREALHDAKAELGAFLRETFPARTFTHATHNSSRIWWYVAADQPAGLRVGIKITLTTDERAAYAAGPSAWRAIEGNA